MNRLGFQQAGSRNKAVILLLKLQRVGQEVTMRLTLIGTAVAALTTATLLAAPANADRFCRKVCEDGFCRSRCVERGERLYMYDRDRDYYHHRRHGFEVEGPGFGVEVDR